MGIRDVSYHITYAARARDLRLAGVPNAKIAEILGVALNTLMKWRDEYPEFDMAWRVGGTEADAKVASALFRRATGYDTKKKREKFSNEGVLLETVEETVHVAPDVGACIFWLTNRQQDLWRQRVENTIPPGSAPPIDAISNEEAARRIAFALAKGLYAGIEDKSRIIENGSEPPSPPETK